MLKSGFWFDLESLFPIGAMSSSLSGLVPGNSGLLMFFQPVLSARVNDYRIIASASEAATGNQETGFKTQRGDIRVFLSRSALKLKCK
jgi:hypothetical protein